MFPLRQLPGWARKNTTAQDLIVLEASGNSFQVVRILGAIDRKALVLESNNIGKLKEVHANNDKISAVRIGNPNTSGSHFGPIFLLLARSAAVMAASRKQGTPP